VSVFEIKGIHFKQNLNNKYYRGERFVEAVIFLFGFFYIVFCIGCSEKESRILCRILVNASPKKSSFKTTRIIFLKAKKKI